MRPSSSGGAPVSTRWRALVRSSPGSSPARGPGHRLEGSGMVRLLGALVFSILVWIESAAAQTPRNYALPDGAAPIALAVDSGGTVWFASRATGAIGRLDRDTGQIALLALGHGAQPSSLVAGP